MAAFCEPKALGFARLQFLDSLLALWQSIQLQDALIIVLLSSDTVHYEAALICCRQACVSTKMQNDNS